MGMRERERRGLRRKGGVGSRETSSKTNWLEGPHYPHNRETCAGLFMLFLWHFHPRSEARSRRVGTGGEAGVTDELKSTRLALKLAPWRGSSLVSMAIKAVSTGGPSVRLLKPSWREVNPRNTSVLGSECVLVDVNRQDEGKSVHLCLWFNVDLPASSFSSSSLVTPLLPSSSTPLLSLSLSHSKFPFWRSRLANDKVLLILLWSTSAGDFFHFAFERCSCEGPLSLPASTGKMALDITLVLALTFTCIIIRINGAWAFFIKSITGAWWVAQRLKNSPSLCWRFQSTFLSL